MEDRDIFNRIISENDDGTTQVRVGINIFRDIEYLYVREFYLGFDEEWYPTNKGISIAADLTNCKEMFVAMAEVISLAESREVIEEYFGDIIKDIYK